MSAVETKVSLIMPCYWANEDLLDMTEQCLHSLEKYPIDETIVVDDGSPFYTEMGHDVEIVHRPENGGYAAAVNTGLAKAIGEILIVSNNDIEFIDPNWLHHLTDPIKQGKADICSIRTTDADGWETRDWLEDNGKFGSIWAISRHAYYILGPLDEGFGKGYFEDLDYWRRARDNHLKVVKNHNGLVEHKGKATFNLVDPDNTAYRTAMFRYKLKHDDNAYLYETDQNAVQLTDAYDMFKLDPPTQAYVRDNHLSLDQIEAKWGRLWE